MLDRSTFWLSLGFILDEDDIYKGCDHGNVIARNSKQPLQAHRYRVHIRPTIRIIPSFSNCRTALTPFRTGLKMRHQAGIFAIWLNLILAAFSEETIYLKIDDREALSNALPLTKNVAALSIEFCYVVEFLGDVGSPNILSRQLLKNLEDRLGEPPMIRIGGDTQDSAEFCPTCQDTLYNVFPGNYTEAVYTSYNANLFRVMAENLSPEQRYIFGIDLGMNNVTKAILQVAALQASPAKNMIWAYELGNEPDHYGSSKRPGGWNATIYGQQVVDWYQKLVNANPTNSLPGFQLFAIGDPPYPGSQFSIEGLTSMGVPQDIRKNGGIIKSLSDHTYPYSICDPKRAALVSLPGLMNHTLTTQYLSTWTTAITTARRTVGTRFHMGETGSVSCHGKEGVSNTLGAALWQIDYVLHGASVGMNQIFFHQGIPYFYSAWWPSNYKGTVPTVWPGYYSFLFLADAIAGLTNTNIYEAMKSDTLVIYAIYQKQTLARLVVIDLEYWLASSKQDRPCRNIDISQFFKTPVNVRRLKGNGSDATMGVTWAGQSFSSGSASGALVVEKLSNMVNVCSSEAVIIG